MLLPARTDTKWFHNFIYNKAEIVFYTDGSPNVRQFAPPRLNLYQPLNASSDRNRLIDDATQAPATFGGIYDETRKCYRFTVTRHIQNILNDKHFKSLNTNLGLYLAVPSDNPVIGARTGIDHTKYYLVDRIDKYSYHLLHTRILRLAKSTDQ